MSTLLFNDSLSQGQQQSLRSLRWQVLGRVRFLLGFAALPPGLALLVGLRQGSIEPVAVFQLLVIVLSTLAFTYFYRKNLNSASWVLTVMLQVICVSGQFQYGPTMGNGVLVLSWMLWAMFMHGTYVMAPLVALLSIIIVSLMAASGLAPEWGIELSLIDWIRMLLTTTILLFGVGFLFFYLIYGLTDALSREVAARQSERAAVAEREAALAAMAESQRLEAIGRLAGGVAHDFNNVLAVLMGGLDTLELVPETKRAALLKSMKQATQAGKATTQQLLSLSKQGSEPGQFAKPHESMRAFTANLKRLLPENIEIQTEIEAVASVGMSTGDFEQMLLNLCLNARDAMPEGGVLELSCRTPEDMADEVEIRVSDTGAGMAPEVASRIFEPFFSTKTKGTGIGLGMVMVQRTVELSCGTIDVESEPGQGTSIFIRLPAAQVKEPVPVTEVEPSPVKGSQKLLLLEDDDGLRMVFSQALSHAGYLVTSVGTVQAALQALTERFEVLVSDVVLPDGSPELVIDQFKGMGGRKVLVCSGYVGDEGTLSGLRDGKYEFMMKPFAPKDLLLRLQKLA